MDKTLAGAREIEFVPDDCFRPLKIEELFEWEAPLEVDVGSGPGAFLIAMAQKFPERNFLGIERLLGRVRSTCKAASRLGLRNVRVLRTENSYAMRHLIPCSSVSVCHVAFPDPWPKRRHWPRRLINREFLDAVAAALVSGGELRIKTDDAAYFAHIRSVVKTCTELGEAEWPHDADYPQTNFERGFLANCLPIYSLRLVKA